MVLVGVWLMRNAMSDRVPFRPCAAVHRDAYNLRPYLSFACALRLCGKSPLRGLSKALGLLPVARAGRAKNSVNDRHVAH